ncbi:MAG: serine/threonine protein kinase [Planctomycetes bacterium]|nr:serine/threonine protein kinase [Planctomycetota bacterium]
MTRPDGVMVQEDRRGRVAICPYGLALSVGGDRDQVHFAIRGDETLRPIHAWLRANSDRSVQVVAEGEAEVFVNGTRITGPVSVPLGGKIRLGPRRTLTNIGVLDSGGAKRSFGLLAIPIRIQDYVFLRLVGRGSSGLVYEAYDEANDRRCAIKLLTAGGRASDGVQDRFRREVDLQSRLGDYPGIVTMWALDTVPGTGELFAIMEFVEGKTLRDTFKAGLERVAGVRLLARVGRAVHYGHERGLLHRDLKPANVMVTESGAVRLTDFGLCKALEEDDGMTATGIMLGTPSYMSPEQVEDAKRVGTPTDIYALGAMLYVHLCGRLPFLGKGVSEVLDAVVSGTKPAPLSVDPTIPVELSDLVVESLSLDPAARPKTALEFSERIERWVKAAVPPEQVSLSAPSTAPTQTAVRPVSDNRPPLTR